FFIEMFVLDLLLLARTPMLFPDPGMQRVFIHSQVSRGLGNRLIRLDRQFHGAFLECSGILLRSGLTHRTHLLGCVLFLVSVCPVEYSHIISRLSPVTLPPGRARLSTRPVLTGSPLTPMTMGIVLVVCLAAWIAGVCP